MSSIIQDGGQFIAFSQNISRIKQDTKHLLYNKILEMILNVLSNETIKMFVAIVLNYRCSQL
jgi:hypothetical protein